MDKSVLDQLKTQNRSSFAIWGEKKPLYPKDVSDMSVFSDYEKLLKRIKPNIIFVGMNLAEDAKNGVREFGNFHSPVNKHNDFRLRDVITGTPFEGAYMTDMFKLMTSSADEVKKYYKNNPSERVNAVKEFVDECRLVCPEKKILICIGTGYHYQTICDLLGKYDDFVTRFSNPIDMSKPCFYIPHYSGAAGNTDEEYQRKASELLARIEKEAETVIC